MITLEKLIYGKKINALYNCLNYGMKIGIS